MTDLTKKRCKPCEGGVKPLTSEQAQNLMSDAIDWTLNETATEIEKTFKFKNFYHTMSFVNAIAWVANQENHHPDLEVSYNCCTVHFSTHSIHGLSENDFICATKIDLLSQQ